MKRDIYIELKLCHPFFSFIESSIIELEFQLFIFQYKALYCQQKIYPTSYYAVLS